MPPIFPILELESVVQEQDKTRLSGLKSYVSGTTAITVMEIRPGKLESLIAVTSDQYLDWQFDFEVDVDADNESLDFDEGSGELTATIAEGSYTLAQLVAAIETALNSAGTLTYEVTLSDDNEITIAANGEFSLLAGSGSNLDTALYPEIGFGSEDHEAGDSFTGTRIERATKEIHLKVTNGAGNETIVRYLPIVSEQADNLFSTDDQLRQHEPDILKFVPSGRATFKDVHRQAQKDILDWLDTQGYIDDLGDKIALRRFLDTDEVSAWAVRIALKLVHEGISNAIDDVYAKKAKKYSDEVTFYRNRAVLRLDLNQDGQISEAEDMDIRSGRVVRR